MKEIMKLIDICIILHNFLVKHNYTEDEKYFYAPRTKKDYDSDIEPLSEDDELNRPIDPNAPGGTRQEQLRAYLSEVGLI